MKKELLKTTLLNLIEDNHEGATAALKSYLIHKMQVVSKISEDATSQEPLLTEWYEGDTYFDYVLAVASGANIEEALDGTPEEKVLKKLGFETRSQLKTKVKTVNTDIADNSKLVADIKRIMKTYELAYIANIDGYTALLFSNSELRGLGRGIKRIPLTSKGDTLLKMFE